MEVPSPAASGTLIVSEFHEDEQSLFVSDLTTAHWGCGQLFRFR